jgi:hypothetical protein
MDLYNDTVSLISKKKQTPNGWLSFNAPCCHHKGENKDTKLRGGLMRSGDAGGLVYHCFNCGFKTGWTPGKILGPRMRSLLGWLGATDDQINKIAFECLKIESEKPSESVLKPLVFAPRAMPDKSVKISTELIEQDERVIPVVEYLYARGLTLEDNDFYWSEKYPDRLIIPLTVEYKTVGYIARKCGPGNPKYITEHPPHVVFNLDKQGYERKFVLVFEGSIDAMLLGGVAVLTNEISQEQAQQINRLDRQVIVVPDRDKAGEAMIRQAADLGWSVAFPEWDNDVKDAADAVLKYGRLATMISIIKSVETNNLKIKLRMKL